MTERLPVEKVREITKEVMADFDSPDLPKLEEISWAFPVARRGLTRFKDGKLLNGQELGAWQSLLLFKNYESSLKYSLEGKGVGRYNQSPIYQIFKDPIDAFDTTHLEWSYYPKFLDQPDNPEVWPKPLKNIPTELWKGYYWNNLPEGLAEMVNQTEDRMRGLNEHDEKVGSPYYNEKLTSSYLSSVRDTLSVGAKYLNNIARNSDESSTWPQMKSVKADELVKGDYIQIAVSGSNGPQIIEGLCSDIEPNKDRIVITYFSTLPWMSKDGLCGLKEPQEYKLSHVKVPLWKLIMPK